MGPVVALGLHTFSVIREVMRNYTGEKDILQYFYKKKSVPFSNSINGSL